MIREEQAADYPRISADLPDYNPRGCQKGACFTEYVYGPQRLRSPLIRARERGEGKWRKATWDEALNFVRLEWADKTRDNATLPKAERSWQGDHLVTQSAATDRFSDACAVMIPAKPVTSELNPSLQMGDAAHPVRVFVWDATRGAAIMEASGRETTKRTGQTFPAQAQYAAGRWTVAMQIPDLQASTPFAVAIWNGSQQDRDGRKYFTIWYRAQ